MEEEGTATGGGMTPACIVVPCLHCGAQAADIRAKTAKPIFRTQGQTSTDLGTKVKKQYNLLSLGLGRKMP